MSHETWQQVGNALKLVLLLGSMVMWLAAIGYAAMK